MNNLSLSSIDSLSTRTDIDAMLSKMRSISAQAKAFGSQAVTKAENASPFHSIMAIAKESIQAVSHTQFQTDTLKDAYLSGDNNVSISQVMISSIKSKVAFEGLVAVRNKLIESYKEIMNMPI
ncbi:MAG: flagellar hook-basal body complex protein FliE [Legionellales bacterium]